MSESNVNRRQRDAVAAMAALIEEEEQQLRQVQQRRFLARLPAPAENRLFGVEALLDRLFDRVVDPEGPLLLSLEGIGGIGKTTAADALMRRAIDQGRFSDYGWVSAQARVWHPEARLTTNEQATHTTLELLEALIVQLLGKDALPAPFTLETATARLADRLHETSHLIVVDNLETMADLETLLPLLQALAGPTRYILTSRQSLQPLTDVFPERIRPLAEGDALSLVRHWAGRSNLPHIAQVDDAAVRPIYETVGGNPLALRLVVGHAHYHDLHRVLASLRSATGESAEQTYSYIYRQAWDNLDVNDRTLLLAMPLLPKEGGDLAYVSTVCGLDEAKAHDALANLVKCSLVDHTRDGLTGRYSIHSLTRTFLLEQEIRWHEDRTLHETERTS
jgi:hypothetical protein